jgi:hypothetical protein
MTLLPTTTVNDLSLCVTADQVTLVRVGQYVHVVPSVAGLDRLFFSGYHKADPGGVVFRILEPLLWECEDVLGVRYWQGFAGLEALLRALFERAGVEVVPKGKRPAPLPPPDLGRLDDLDPHDTTLLEFVQQHERGLIRLPAGGAVRPARLVAQVALAYPELRVAVAVTRNADARAVARALASYGVKAARGGRVLAGTYLDLLEQKKALPRLDIFFALNPTELFHTLLNAGMEVVKRLDRARVYGLVADDLRVAPRLRDLLTALFGAEAIYVPKHGHRPLPVDVVMVPVYGGGRPPNHKDDHVVKRLGVHEHELRNRRVAKLAEALAGRDFGLLKGRFPAVAALGKGRVRGRVGVLVDTVDHGLTLAAKLGWPLVAGAAVNGQGLSAAHKALLKAGRDKQRRAGKPVVVTAAGLAHAGRLEVLIRADAGTGLPPIPAARLRVRSGQDRRLLLVDFLDRHHPVLRRWSRQRQQAYRDAGWAIVGEAPLTALDRFLATRPEVLR